MGKTKFTGAGGHSHIVFCQYNKLLFLQLFHFFRNVIILLICSFLSSHFSMVTMDTDHWGYNCVYRSNTEIQNCRNFLLSRFAKFLKNIHIDCLHFF